MAKKNREKRVLAHRGVLGNGASWQGQEGVWNGDNNPTPWRGRGVGGDTGPGKISKLSQQEPEWVSGTSEF